MKRKNYNLPKLKKNQSKKFKRNKIQIIQKVNKKKITIQIKKKLFDLHLIYLLINPYENNLFDLNLIKKI